jgi:hypothetical protein
VLPYTRLRHVHFTTCILLTPGAELEVLASHFEQSRSTENNEYMKHFFDTNLMRPGREADHSSACRAEIKNVWRYEFTPPLPWCFVKHRDKFTFYLYLTISLWRVFIFYTKIKDTFLRLIHVTAKWQRQL